MSGLGVLLVGAGHYGAVHANALDHADGVRLVGVVDIALDRATELAAVHDVPSWDDLEVAVTASGADVVAVVVPTAQHTDVVLRALRQGVHVVVEKPVCLDLADLSLIEEEAARQGKVVDVISQRRYQAGIYAAKAAVDSGALGRITSAQCDTSVWRGAEYFTEAPWRGDPTRGGGNLMNHGMHALDLLLWFLGDAHEVTARHARSKVPGVVVEEVLVGTLSFEDALATLHASLVSFPGDRMRLMVTGSDGTLDIDGGTATLVQRVPGSSETQQRTWQSQNPDEAMRAQYEDLARVVTGAGGPRVGLAAGARAVRTARALLASAADHGVPTTVPLATAGASVSVSAGAGTVSPVP